MDKLTESHNFLHTFCIKPNVKFETQGDNEEVILVLRAHPITLVPWILNSIIISILLIALNLVLPSVLSVRQIIFFNFLIITTIFAYIWFNILFFIFNVGIVTNERIVDVNFSSVLFKEISTADLNKVEDITAESGGFLASIINYGNLFIQTAGTNLNIKFQNIPNPALAEKIINELAH